MDPKDKRSVDEYAEEERDTNESLNMEKCCTDCQTTKTPLWRGGPAGPKSLCNACGIKYNKKRRAQVSGIDKNGRGTSKSSKGNGDLKLKVKLMVVNQNKKLHHHRHHNHQQQQQQKQKQRKRSSYERGKPWWNKLREEEQAAILLMAISCGGSLYS